MSQNPARLESILNNGYDFKFGEYINKGFRIFGKNSGLFIGYLIVYFFISGCLGSIPFLGELASFVITGPLMVGFYIVADKIERDEYVEFSNFFDGFKSWLTLFLAILLNVVIMVAIMIPFVIFISFKIGLDFINEDTMPSFGAIDIVVIALFVLVVLYFTISYIYSFLFIIFDGMDAWAALEASRKIVSKNIILHWFFLAIWMLITIICVLPLGLGLLASIPAFYCSVYAAWADITGFYNETREDDDILRHLID